MPRMRASAAGTAGPWSCHVVRRQPWALPAKDRGWPVAPYGEQPESSTARAKSRRYARLRLLRRCLMAMYRSGRSGARRTPRPRRRRPSGPCPIAFMGAAFVSPSMWFLPRPISRRGSGWPRPGKHCRMISVVLMARRSYAARNSRIRLLMSAGRCAIKKCLGWLRGSGAAGRIPQHAGPARSRREPDPLGGRPAPAGTDGDATPPGRRGRSLARC